MKYLKNFEHKQKFGKDYSNKYHSSNNCTFDYIHKDIKKLKSNNIKFTLYYYKDHTFGLLFKIFLYDYISQENKNILKNELYFMDLPDNYEFTFNWIPIEEDDADIIISIDKYNL